MRTAITSILIVGAGAAVATMMTDRRNRKRMMSWIEPVKNMNMDNMMPRNSSMKQMQKRIMRMVS
jgi:hypothetical protein